MSEYTKEVLYLRVVREVWGEDDVLDTRQATSVMFSGPVFDHIHDEALAVIVRGLVEEVREGVVT